MKDRATPMKLPRWLVVSLLVVSALAVFGVGLWWWVTWPARTLRAFADLTAAGKVDEATRLTPGFKADACTVCHRVNLDGLPAQDPPIDPAHSLSLLVQLQYLNRAQFQVQPRTIGEMLTGQQRFELGGVPVLAVRGNVARIECGVSHEVEFKIVYGR